mmetsp:Transcript_2929/g.4869  ORF Transcript_2929/g.4869 Transcript_2929/m.4869 type:complete len:88 (+) Transcript_2929:483-746(+)
MLLPMCSLFACFLLIIYFKVGYSTEYAVLFVFFVYLLCAISVLIYIITHILGAMSTTTCIYAARSWPAAWWSSWPLSSRASCLSSTL